MITRTKSLQKTAPKSDFLSTAQRQDLKSKLVDKFTKLYGLSCPSYVKQELDAFFSAGGPVNSKTLSELEKKIRAECFKYRTNKSKPKETQNTLAETKTESTAPLTKIATPNEPNAKPPVEPE